jgi:hypothetical protein
MLTMPCSCSWPVDWPALRARRRGVPKTQRLPAFCACHSIPMTLTTRLPPLPGPARGPSFCSIWAGLVHRSQPDLLGFGHGCKSCMRLWRSASLDHACLLSCPHGCSIILLTAVRPIIAQRDCSGCRQGRNASQEVEYKVPGGAILRRPLFCSFYTPVL